MARADDIVADHLSQSSGRDSAHLYQRLRDSGQGWRRAACNEGVIEPHHTEVFGYTDGSPTCLLHDSQGDLVTRCEDRRRPVGSIQQIGCDVPARVVAQGAVGDQRLVQRVMPLALWAFQGEYSMNIPAVLAAVVLSTLPILVLYVVGRRQLLRGLTAGFGK
jgi:hypothetical protein